jgi:hypothetical protein
MRTVVVGLCRCTTPQPVKMIGSAARCYGCLRWVGQGRRNAQRAQPTPEQLEVQTEQELADALLSALQRPPGPSRLYRGHNSRAEQVLHLRLKIARLEAELHELLERPANKGRAQPDRPRLARPPERP